MLLRTRDLLMRQRTQVINALRWHLAELGIVAANSYCHVRGRLPIALALPVSLSRANGSNGSSTRLSNAGVLRPDMTSSRSTIWPS